MSAAPFSLTDAELLERLRAVRGLEASLVAELRARRVEPPLVPQCGHPQAEVSGVRGEHGDVLCVDCGQRYVEYLAREAQADFAARFKLLPDSEDLRALRVVGGER